LHRNGADFRVEVSADQAELEAVATLVSSLIPQSLFLQNYSIEEIESLSEIDEMIQEDVSYEVPYCPECQTALIETLNPFAECHVCGFSDVTLTMNELQNFTELSAETNEMFFTRLADRLLETGELTLPTFNGLRNFSLLSHSKRTNNAILFCNPINISDDFVITSGELEALMMVEKPVVRLKPKLKFRSKYTLNEPFYPLFFADDKVTLALCETLKRRGVDAIFCDNFSTLRVASSLEEHVVVKAGRDLLPWKHPLVLESASFCRYNSIEAFGNHDGLEVNSKVSKAKSPYIHYVANHHSKNSIHFEPSHAALRSIVLEQNLEGASLCGIYLSRENPSQICSYSPKIGYTSMVQFSDEKLFQPKQMLDAIAQMDESGLRLIENFQKSLPELYQSVEELRFSEDENISMIARLWAMAAVFIGLYKKDNALKACETLEATAIEFSGKSGPRIDYKILSTNEGYTLDARLSIRSAISFKLAGVDEYLLSFGFIDSLADFIAQQVENADANIGISGVTMSGTLFENRQLLMRTDNALSANYPLYKNRRLGLDGANVALGAITLGSE